MFATLAGAYPPPPLAATRPHDPLRTVLLDQLEAGFELLSDGVGTLRSPVVALPARPEPAVVTAWLTTDALARTLAAERGEPPRPVKASLLGPYTLGRLAERGRLGRRRVTLAFTETVAADAAALAAAGALIVQVDEPALVRIGPDDAAERTLAAEAFRRLIHDVPDVHLTLAVMDGSAEAAGARLFFDAPFHSYLFDLSAGPDNWRLISQAPTDRGIVAGVADARAARLDTMELLVWGARYAAALNGRGLDRVGIAPSSGLEGLTHAQARAKIRSLGEAARIAGLTDVEELRRSVDPRAVDLRSAALGRYDPEAEAAIESRRRARRAGRAGTGA